MRAFALLLLVALAAPQALATQACAQGACVEGWSAKNGSCGGAGSERNVLAARVHDARAGDASVAAETFCVTAGEQRYRSWTLDASAGATRIHLLWASAQSDCGITVYETSPLGGQTRSTACRGAMPPAVPALLP